LTGCDGLLTGTEKSVTTGAALLLKSFERTVARGAAAMATACASPLVLGLLT
jgi:hypothetical protein